MQPHVDQKRRLRKDYRRRFLPCLRDRRPGSETPTEASKTGHSAYIGFLARGAVLHCRRRLRGLHCRRRRIAVRHCRQRWRAASHHCRRRLRVLQCQERHFRGLQHRLRRWIRFGGLQQRLRGWKPVFGRPRKSVFRRCQKIFVPWTEGC